MIEFFKKIFGGRPSVDLKALVQNGAQIIDVRSPEEYQGGHIKGSLNIPLSVLPNSMSRINKNKPVITCCASGIRSVSARGLLKSKGYDEVYNGGAWSSLQNKIS